MPDNLPEANINPPQPPIAYSENKNTGHKKLYFILAFLLIISLCIFMTFVYFRPDLRFAESQPNSSQIINYPLDPSNDYVRVFGVFYDINAKVERVVSHPEGYELITNVEGLPQLIIRRFTIIATPQSEGAKSLTINDIKTGQDIIVTISYYSNKWVTNKVVILGVK